MYSLVRSPQFVSPDYQFCVTVLQIYFKEPVNSPSKTGVLWQSRIYNYVHVHNLKSRVRVEIQVIVIQIIPFLLVLYCPRVTRFLLLQSHFCVHINFGGLKQQNKYLGQYSTLRMLDLNMGSLV